MALKDIIVHVDGREPAARRIDAAAALAAAHDARLIGLYAIPRLIMPSYAEVQISAEVLENYMSQALEAAAETGAAFEQRAAKAGVITEWRAVEAEAGNLLAAHGRYADLVIMGQPEEDSGLLIGSDDLPDRVFMDVGRPVLLIPYVADYPVIGRRVMIAWDGSRTATRAVHDALPLMVGADKVSIMCVNPPRGEYGLGDLPGADIAAHLARHGIEAEADHIDSKDVPIAAMLESRAADFGADLMVMGAYGHTRVREMILGGVTRSMIESMPVPVLMSH